MRDAGRKIGRDLPCVRCGYNLRGLSSADHCPECNAPANVSVLRQGFLRFVTHASPLIESHPQWMRSVVAGMSCLACAIGLEFVSPFVMQYPFDPTTGLVARSMLAAASWACFAAGVFKLTRAEPGANNEGLWALRFAAGAYVIVTASLLLVWTRVPKVMAAPHAAAAFATTVLLHTHLANLARRLPSKWLSIVARVAGLTLPFVGCLSSLMAMGVFAGPATFGPVSAVSRFLLPGGIDAMFARPAQSFFTLLLVAIGCTPIHFLVIWYARPREGRAREAT